VTLRELLRKIVPTRIAAWIHRLRGLQAFTGDFASFDEASRHATGYNSSAIAESTLRDLDVQQPDADSTPQPRVEQLLTALRAAGTGDRPLSVVDVGGGVGAYYYPLRKYFPGLEWTVIETPEMVRAAARVQSPIRFVDSFEQLAPPYDVALMSGAIQYFPDPYATLRQYAGVARHLLVTRLPLIERDRITVQKVVSPQYSASYPAWFFSRDRFLGELQALGTVIERWDVPQDQPFLDGRRVMYCGVLVRVAAR
jgi:putative methyltransferase (TIGR04325 family)